MAAHRPMSAWRPRAWRGHAWACVTAFALLVLCASAVRVALLDTVPDGPQAAASPPAAATAASGRGRPGAQGAGQATTDVLARARARIWMQGASAIAIVLLLFGGYELSLHAGLLPTPGGVSPRGPTTPPRTDRLHAGDMLAIAGSRMRQPLHALSLFAGSLNRDALPGQRPALQGLEAGVRELARVIDETERISRLLHREAPAQPADLSAAGLFAGVRPAVEHEARLADIDLRWCSGGLRLHSDPLLAQRLLQVLVEDSIRRARNRVLVAARPRAGRVVLQVRDDGEPLEPAPPLPALDRLSQRARDADGRDAALGLAVGADIADLLEANATLRSGRSGGNTVSIDFPRARLDMQAPDDATVLTLALLASEARQGQRMPSRLDDRGGTVHGDGTHPGSGNVEPAPVRAAPSDAAHRR